MLKLDNLSKISIINIDFKYLFFFNRFKFYTNILFLFAFLFYHIFLIFPMEIIQILGVQICIYRCFVQPVSVY